MVSWPKRGTTPWDTPLKAYLDGSFASKAATEAALARVDPGTPGSVGQSTIIDRHGDPQWRDGVIPAEAYLDLSSGGDDAPALQAAVDAAEVIATGTGRVQTVDLGRRAWVNAGTTAITVNASKVRLEGLPGCEISGPNLPAYTPVIAFAGSISTDVTTITGDIARGALTVTVASASGLAVGDVLLIRSTELFNPDKAQYTKGEMVDVAGVAGTTVTLAAPTRDSYTASGETISVDVITPLEDVGLRHVRVVGSGVTNGYAVTMRYCDGIDVDHVQIIDGKQEGMSISHSRHITVADSSATGSDQTGLGYGVLLTGCEDAVIERFRGRGNRHSVDASNNLSSGISRDITFRSVRAYHDLSAGISTHGGTQFVTIEDCHTYGCGGGIVTRGSDTTIDRCTVNGSASTAESYFHGILIGDASDTSGDGIGGTNLTIRDCRVDVTGLPSGGYDGMRVNAPLINARITGTIFTGFRAHGIHVRTNRTRNMMFDGNTIDCTAQTISPSWGVFWNTYPDTTSGNTHRDITFRANRVISPTTSAFRMHGDSTGVSGSGGDFVFDKNNVTDAGSWEIEMWTGYFEGAWIDLGVRDGAIGTPVRIGANATNIVIAASSTGTPEEAFAAPVGSQYHRLDGGTGTTLYIKESGTGDTGWVAK